MKIQYTVLVALLIVVALLPLGQVIQAQEPGDDGVIRGHDRGADDQGEDDADDQEPRDDDGDDEDGACNYPDRDKLSAREFLAEVSRHARECLDNADTQEPRDGDGDAKDRNDPLEAAEDVTEALENLMGGGEHSGNAGGSNVDRSGNTAGAGDGEDSDYYEDNENRKGGGDTGDGGTGTGSGSGGQSGSSGGSGDTGVDTKAGPPFEEQGEDDGGTVNDDYYLDVYGCNLPDRDELPELSNREYVQEVIRVARGCWEELTYCNFPDRDGLPELSDRDYVLEVLHIAEECSKEVMGGNARDVRGILDVLTNLYLDLDSATHDGVAPSTMQQEGLEESIGSLLGCTGLADCDAWNAAQVNGRHTALAYYEAIGFPQSSSSSERQKGLLARTVGSLAGVRTGEDRSLFPSVQHGFGVFLLGLGNATDEPTFTHLQTFAELLVEQDLKLR